MRRRGVVLSLLALIVTAVSVPTAAAADGTKYVAMGSSFAAGPGIPSLQPGSPSVCARSDHNYPSVLAAQLGLALTDVSCSGATTANILDSGQAGLPPQIQAVTPDTRLVTATIGGNDVNYIGSLNTYSCQTSGRTGCGTVDQNAINATFGVLQSRLENVANAVRQRAPQAKMVFVEYLSIVPTAVACDGVPLTREQLAFEHSIALRLADSTRAAALSTGSTVVEVTPASRGHDACSATPWVEKYTVPSGRTPYHPNEAGMNAVARLVRTALTR
ncbi:MULTISPECIES: SGNH/GDSL hydrolase family protein [Amycolatopsis]|uniref:GDSL-like Lipase/Acylhydrolase family protein n=2 Tax=Amycolatopsis TaxID=1813 RepID=A0A1I4BLU7_9PSEU|nr:SGNH/GDSL hydrolase family protein [Amycolatopsis sacchari]SFK69748.1 GDSL-like Lipase/Acylhydrolase family protein [Amycolatopsis sacchari]